MRFFFFPLSSTHSKRERCLKTTTTCVFRPRCRNVRNVFLSLHACAKRLNSSLLSSSFKNKPAKHAHCNIIKTTEDLEYSKPPRSTFYGKRKGCSPPDRLPGNVIFSSRGLNFDSVYFPYFFYCQLDLKGQNLGT